MRVRIPPRLMNKLFTKWFAIPTHTQLQTILAPAIHLRLCKQSPGLGLLLSFAPTDRFRALLQTINISISASATPILGGQSIWGLE